MIKIVRTMMRIDVIASFIISVIATWAIPKYFLIALVHDFGHEFPRWIYGLIFVFIFGFLVYGFTKTKEDEKNH